MELGHNFDSSPSLPALNPTFVAAKPRPKVRRLKEHLAAELGVSRFRLQLFDDNGPVEETAVIDSRHQDWSCLVSLKQFWSIFGVEGGSGIQKLRFGFITFNAFCLFHFSIIFLYFFHHVMEVRTENSGKDLQLLILAFCPKEDSRLIHAVQRNHWRRLEDLLRMPQDPDVTESYLRKNNSRVSFSMFLMFSCHFGGPREGQQVLVQLHA